VIIWNFGSLGKQEEKRVKEELKLTLEKLQRKAVAEQNRAAHRRQKQVPLEVQVIRLHHSGKLLTLTLIVAGPIACASGAQLTLCSISMKLTLEFCYGVVQLESEAQQRRELLRYQRELAGLHSLRRSLLHYGLRPWHRFLLQCR
jgi:hypothetical protein